MPKLLLHSLSLLPCLAFALPALASSSGWIETEGGSVRLVTTGKPDAEGKLRGALEIALKPGWKTYWRDPGEAGVAPTLDITDSINVSSAAIDFPPPKRFDDGYSVWAGYNRPVTLPVTFTVDRPERFAAIDATVFLGICETICIPVQGELSLAPGSAPEDPQDKATVQAAFAALPAPAREGFEVSHWRLTGQTLIAEADLPADASGGELFVSASDGFVLGTPVRAEQDGAVVFEIPVLERPEKPKDADIRYVLVTEGEAVAGAASLP